MKPRELGNRLEDQIAEKLQSLGDKFARRSRMSGGQFDVGDVVSSWFFVQAKKRNTKHITISRDEWTKLDTEIPVNSLKPIIYVNENQYGEKFVTMDYDDFFRIIKENKEG